MANTNERMQKIAACNALGFTTMASLLPRSSPERAGGLLKRAYNMQGHMDYRMAKQASRHAQVRNTIVKHLQAA